MSGKSRPARRFAGAVLLAFGVLLFPDLSSYAVTGVPTSCTPDAGYDECLVFTAVGADQSWSVPAGVKSASVQLWGAGGAGSGDKDRDGSTGGTGGYASGLVALTPGATYVVMVGAGGVADSDVVTYGGGGAGGRSGADGGGGKEGGSGGGLTGLFASTAASPSSAVLIAGGGGGAGVTRDSAAGATTKPVAGGGGGAVGGNDAEPTISGRGATATDPGLGGSDSLGCTQAAPGVALAGGAGGDTVAQGSSRPAGGGGGGGWFGGGGGRCGDGATTGHGGGGSAYAHPTLVSNSRFVAGANGVFLDSGLALEALELPKLEVSPAAYLPAHINVDAIATGGVADVGAQGGHGLAVIQWQRPATAAPAATPSTQPTPAAASPSAAPAPASSAVPVAPAVTDAPSVVPATFVGGLVLPPGQQGVPYTGQLPPISGGSGPLTCTANVLPTGLVMDTAKCQITGIPTQVGTSQVTVQIAGVGGIAGSGSTVFEITEAEVEVRAPHGHVGDRYESGKPHTGLDGKVTWSAKGLPPGLRVDPETGRISGVPRSTGRFTVKLRATSDEGFRAVTKVRVVVKRPTTAPHGVTMPSTGARIEVRKNTPGKGIEVRRAVVRKNTPAKGIEVRRAVVRKNTPSKGIEVRRAIEVRRNPGW